MLRASVFGVALMAGCSGAPDTYTPAMPRVGHVGGAVSRPVRQVVSMNDPTVRNYIVADVSDTTEDGAWRWTYRRPELRFFLPVVDGLEFTMEFAIPERMVAEVGPVTLSFYVNGKPLDRIRYERGGRHEYRKAAPAAMLRAGTDNFVLVETDRVWSSGLGFILVRAGFVD